MKKVDFFIVGAPKAGTTSLYYYLNEHIDIEMSSQKEPDFFSDQSLQKKKLYYGKNRIDTLAKYHSLFHQKNVILRGDASVSYLFYDDVPSKIKEYNSDAKIIIMLRNPIDRAFSHYLMDYALGLLSDSFDSIIHKKSRHKNADLFYQQYINVGEYASQVKRYLDIFNRQNIFFIDYEEFKNNTSDIVNSVFGFLGLDNDFEPDLTKKHNVYRAPKNMLIRHVYSYVFLRKILVKILPKKMIDILSNFVFQNSKKPKISDSTKGILKEHFKSDLQELSLLLNKDFSKWIR